MLLALPGLAAMITEMSYMTTASVNSSTDAYNGHKLPCTEEEQSKSDCLHGKCIAVDLNPRVSLCSCDSGWTGRRCELMDLPPEWWNASQLAGLIIGLIVAVLFFAAALVGFYLWKRRRGTHNIRNQANGLRLDVVAETPLCPDESKE